MPMPSQSASPALLADRVKKEVLEQYERQLPAFLPFSNVHRIERSLEALRKICEGEEINERQADLLAMALSFHFAGMVEDVQAPTEAARQQARAFLEEHDYPTLRITQVEQLLDTAGDKKIPESRYEKVLSDALHSYLGQKKYRSRSELRRQERQINYGEPYDPVAWQQECLKQLQHHTFYTPTAQQLYEERKQINVRKTKKRIEKYRKAARKKTTIKGNRAIRMIFKTALRNHIDLTNIADRKANMMLSINALILTIGLPLFSTYLSDQPYLFLPAGAFLLTAIFSMLFATLSTRPIKMTGETRLEDIPSGKTNLFFFGNFYKLSQEEYFKGIESVLKNEKIVEKSIVNDLYHLGRSLGSKFAYLRICYNVFVVGICLSAVAFIVAFLLWSNQV